MPKNIIKEKAAEEKKLKGGESHVSFCLRMCVVV
jgi:hypothetical protein